MSEAKILDTSTVKALLPDALLFRVEKSDMDTITQTGVYYVGGETVQSGWPAGAYPYGVLAVFNAVNFIAQILFTHHDVSWSNPGSAIYFRIHFNSWTQWSKVNATVLST